MLQRPGLTTGCRAWPCNSRVLLPRQQQCSRAVIACAQPAAPNGNTTQKCTGVAAQVAEQTNWSDGMATIQALMSRVQEQLQAHSSLRFNNPQLASELKAKAEKHLELLMQLAESQQEQHIQGSSSSSNTSDLQQLLRELQVQLDLEQQAMLTAAANVNNTSTATTATAPPGRRRRSTSSSRAANAASTDTLSDSDSSTSVSSARNTSKNGATPHTVPGNSSAAANKNNSSADDALQLQLQQAQAEAASLQNRLSTAEAQVSSLQQQLADVEHRLHSNNEELSEHRELQMAYDKQCQDLYRLRMQLQLSRTQGNDAVSLAAQANKQHKQDLAWLMDAHRKEISDAHKKNQELIQQVQEMRLKLLEQDQLVWSLGGATNNQQLRQQPEQEQQQQQEPEAQQQALQQQEEAQLQLQQLQESAEQLAAEKQQLMKSLQDSQREQAVLLVELQNLRSAAEAAAEAAASAATSSRDAEATAIAEAAVAAEQVLKVQLQETQQQRDSLVEQVQNLQASLLDAKAAAEEAAKASKVPAAATGAAVVPAASAGAAAGLGQLDAVAAVEQLKVAKVEMANLRVQLADARRELKQASGRAAAAEAALQKQAAGFEARLAQLQAWYNKQAAVVAQLRRGKAPKDGQVGFTNTNKFWVRQELLFEFLKHWVTREAQLQQQEGFLGLQVQPGVSVSADGGVDVVVSSLWENIPAWEAWSKSAVGTQQHMPTGVYQYVPGKGEGFPEAFVPFRDYDEPVNAKY